MGWVDDGNDGASGGTLCSETTGGVDNVLAGAGLKVT